MNNCIEQKKTKHLKFILKGNLLNFKFSLSDLEHTLKVNLLSLTILIGLINLGYHRQCTDM